MNVPLLEIDGLRVDFPGEGNRPLHVVRDVTLEVGRGESVGLVGESGCGKTTLANAVVGLTRPSAGVIRFDGQNVLSFGKQAQQRFRRNVQMVFQDPYGSLNPRMTVQTSIEEVLKVHGLTNGRAARRARVGELLQCVGLEARYADRYPHEFSGGQRQRIGIARALAVDPSLVIADEPVSALDVSVQVQILNLMKRLGQEMGLAFLLIAHDLAVVHYMCSRILVMYLGKIVEGGPADDVFARPAHPYTEALVSAVPDVDRGLGALSGDGGRIVLRGEVPSPADDVPGCPFHPRCHRARDVCRSDMPPQTEPAPSRFSRCHFAEEMLAEIVVKSRTTRPTAASRGAAPRTQR